MTRAEQILFGITKDMRGIEIAPWFAPLAPKSDGFDCLTLDLFDREELVRRARSDESIAPEAVALIDDVDFVGSATDIETIVPQNLHGTFDYIVSSHNFEHLPDPIKFLRGCERILRQGGRLSMAVPDARACFDFFRPHTTIGDWLEAYHERRTRPSRGSRFQGQAYSARLIEDDAVRGAFSIENDPRRVQIVGDLAAAYAAWIEASDSDPYVDAHCSVFTPASFRLLIEECRYLGLIGLRCESISDPAGCEFHVRMVNAPEETAPDGINALRSRLALEIWKERAEPLMVGSDSSKIPKETVSREPKFIRKKDFSYRFERRLMKILSFMISSKN
jgi:SAM-dependent methyltransferase